MPNKYCFALTRAESLRILGQDYSYSLQLTAYRNERLTGNAK